MKYTKQEYQEYLEKKSPNSSLPKDMLAAFVVGGTICVIGQAIFDIYKNVGGMSDDAAKTAISITMIFLGAFLTGIDVYGKLAKFGGGGTLVPITGFANAIVSPAMEFKREGLVMGLAAKMFSIAGPVLVYGICASAAIGAIYYICGFFTGGAL